MLDPTCIGCPLDICWIWYVLVLAAQWIYVRSDMYWLSVRYMLDPTCISCIYYIQHVLAVYVRSGVYWLYQLSGGYMLDPTCIGCLLDIC